MDAASATIIVGLLGMLIGTFISPYLNRRLNTKFQKRDIFFSKKLEYLESIAISIEDNVKIYHNSICQLNDKRNQILAKKLFNKIKKERKKFFIRASPIYFSTIVISNKIRNFTQTEKSIFYDFEKIIKERKVSDSMMTGLRLKLEKIKKIGSEIINEAKMELLK